MNSKSTDFSKRLLPRIQSQKAAIGFIMVAFSAVYLFFAPSNLPLYDLILFPCPDPRIPNVDGQLEQLHQYKIETKEVVFPSSNGRLLHGILFRMPNTNRVILLSHTKGNNMYQQISKAKLLMSCGASVFMYDYQGFGRSQGKPSVEGACDDGVAAYDYLVTKENFNNYNIIAMGESFGSGVTGQLCLRRKLAAVIMHSGFASLISAGRDKLFWLRLYPDWSFPKQMMDNIAVFSKPHPPLLIVHGKTDPIISCSEALNLFNKAAEPKNIFLVPQGHCSFGRGNQFATEVRKFLLENKL